MNTSYPRFLSQKVKSAVIREVHRLYEKGKLIQGRQRDGHGGACVLGVIVDVGMNTRYGAVLRNNVGPWTREWEDRIVEVNDIGFRMDQISNDGQHPLVPPSAYNELIQILKDSPVEEEK